MAITGYRILRKIRQGGMSTVYLAIQKSVDREVALKVMSPSLSSDPSFGSRFYREAKIVGQLSHPNIVSIYDVGSHKQYSYMAMDYLPGSPLQDRLEHGVTPSQALKITSEIACALDYAHERGYVHRDIKPDNILFRANDSAVLCDFGIAKSYKSAVKMTSTGAVLGTPHYMSPEQVQGKEIDGRADLYSLGAVLFEMLSGHVPYSGDDAVAVAVKHVSSNIPKLSSELRKFQPLINRLLAKKPSARFQTGKELIDAITALQTSLSNSTSSYLTNPNSTKLQILSLIRALSSTLTSAINLSIKRFIFGQKTFTEKTIQLSEDQLEEIDQFVLDTIPPGTFIQTQSVDPSLTQQIQKLEEKRSYKPWLYWTSIIVVLITGGYFYLDQQYPQLLQQIDTEKLNFTKHATPTVTEQIPLQVKSTPKPIVIDKPAVINKVPATAKTVTFPLTVISQPPDAKIRILNIRPLYEPEILLKAGSYHIEVAAENYETKRFWLKMSDKALTHSVNLESTRKALPAGSIIVDQLADGGQANKMVVLASQDTIKLATPIAVGQHEITFDQYDQFAKLNQRPLPLDYGWGRGSRPVVGISFEDAQAFAQWTSQQTGHHYRLPTQQEWEYITHASLDNKFWWGNVDLTNKANCRKGCKSQWSKFFSSSTAPVGSFPADDNNLHDIVGNAAEWLNNCTKWQNEDKSVCVSALVAGGSHKDDEKKININPVVSTLTNEPNNTIGMRLVLDL